MTTPKSLTEEIAEVMTSKYSQATKRFKLAHIGLTSGEIGMLFAIEKANAKANGTYVEPTRRENLASLISKMTFGVEIECINAPHASVVREALAKNVECRDEYSSYNHNDSRTAYRLVYDGSLSGSNSVECVTPVLEAKKSGFGSLKAMCEVLNSVGADVNRSCGLHIHVGYSDITDEHYVNVFKNYQMLERIIDSFMAKSRRANNATYCRSLLDHDFSNCTTKVAVFRQLGGRDYTNRNELRQSSRYHKMNACAYFQHGTIEFRHHQGTVNYEKIEMWARFCLKLVAWSKDHVLTNEITSIDKIPFLSATEKNFYKARAEHFNGCSIEEVA